MEESKKIVMDIASSEWDTRPLSIAHEISEFLKSMIDEGTYIESGSMSGVSDLWATIGGVEYLISISTDTAQNAT